MYNEEIETVGDLARVLGNMDAGLRINAVWQPNYPLQGMLAGVIVKDGEALILIEEAHTYASVDSADYDAARQGF